MFSIFVDILPHGTDKAKIQTISEAGKNLKRTFDSTLAEEKPGARATQMVVVGAGAGTRNI